jgi:SAM-dependent methyltransferase
MLHAARRRAVRVALIAGDAAALPLRDDASDLTLAMHVLDHVPDPGAAVAELRRTTRPGGQVLVVLNRPDHLRELREAVASALPAQADGQPITIGGRLRLDDGARLLAREFTAVARHEVTSELLIPGPEPVESYIRSMTLTQALPRPSAFAAAVLRQLPRDQNGTIRIQAHTGCLVAS